MRRVLFVTSNFPRWPGDSTTPFVLHLAQDLRSLGWDVEVLAPHAPDAPFDEVLEGIPVRRFQYAWPVASQTVCYNGGALLNLRKSPANYFKLPAFVVSEFLAIWRRLKSGNFDLVHSHWLLPQGFAAGIAARMTNVPHVATVHGGDVFALRNPLFRAFKRKAVQWADAVTANSTATVRAVNALCPTATHVSKVPIGAGATTTPDALEAEELRRKFRRGGGPLLVFVGRMIEEKGVGDLLEAIHVLSDALPGVTAVLVGEGPDRALFEARSIDLGLKHKVHFAGWVEPARVASYLAAADIFVAPSKQSRQGWVEAQGLVYVEAMLAGCPVIACDTGGVGDVVRHERTGLLVEEASPRQIAAAIQRLCAEPELRHTLARNGQLLARRDYTREASARRFTAVYEEVLRRRVRTSR